MSDRRILDLPTRLHSERVIAFMRFMRPGMVVGPQQHWLHLNQCTFREWWFEDTMKEACACLAINTNKDKPKAAYHEQ
jgi:hypothetical protein